PLATPIIGSTPTATATRAPDQVPFSTTLTPGLGATRTITLTIWAPEEFAPGTTRSGQVLQRQLDEFSHAHPDITLNFVLKNRYGPGGLLDFLLKVQSLVPGRLPDLVLMDSRE